MLRINMKSFSLIRQLCSKSGQIRQICTKNNVKICWWFGTCAGMCALTTTIGGLTRLTESGLSMTDWKFLGDVKLPLTLDQWQVEFERYQEFPEWKLLNKDRGLTLEGFKYIYFLEYLHRNLGKLTGAFFILPLPFFWTSLTRSGRLRSLGLGSLIGLQGFIGWYMVKSGLHEEMLGPEQIPRVSHYRLAMHLGSAFVLFCGLLWSAMDCYPKKIRHFDRNIKMMAGGMLGLTALVAGLDAGLIYDTFPLMGNKIIPDDYVSSRFNKVENIFNNPAAVQFNHRVIGISCAILSFFIYKKSKPIVALKRPATAVLHSTLLQMSLGIATILLGVPVWLASMHQVGALTMTGSLMWLLKRLSK